MINSRWRVPLLITVVAMVFTGCTWFMKQPAAGGLTLTASFPVGVNPAKVTATLTHSGSDAVVNGNLTIRLSDAKATGNFNNLAPGDWDVVVTLYNAQGDEIASESGTVTIVDKRSVFLDIYVDVELSPNWLGQPEVDPYAVQVGELTLVRVSMLVNRPADELAPANGTSPVEVFVWSGGVQPSSVGNLDNDSDWTFLDYLYDNGDLGYGDEIKGDRVYSNYFAVEADKAGILPFRIVVTTSEGDPYYVPLEIVILETEEDAVETVIDIHEDAVDILNTMDASKSAEEMLDELAEWLESLPDVDSTSRNGDLLQIVYTSGLISFIHLHEEDMEGGLSRGGGASAATVDSLRNITDYGMVVFATHGSGGAWLATGEIAYKDDWRYEIDLNFGHMAIWQEMKKTTDGVEKWEPVYAVNDEWLQIHMNGIFPNSVIVNNSCESTATDRLWNVFQAAGAGAYFGYSKIVYSQFAVNQVHELVDGLAAGKTTGESYTQKTDPQGSYKAVWEMRGDKNLAFAAGLLNGSFEDGLAGWNTVGDGRVIYALGHLLPTDGVKMGIISTGLGFTYEQGTIRQTFRVDDDATYLKFDWNFLSEEFLEWIHSVYMDWFRVSITADGGEHVLLHKTIDDIAHDFGASECASDLDPAECIVNGSSGSLIHVSPHIIFDVGDVWMTGWQSASFDISEFRGQRVTLTFSAHDFGDSEFDTAILLDNIRIE